LPVLRLAWTGADLRVPAPRLERPDGRRLSRPGHDRPDLVCRIRDPVLRVFHGAPRDAAAPSVGVGLAGLFRPVDRGDPGAGARVAPGGLQQIPDRRVPAALAGAWWAGGPRAGARGRAAGVVQSLTTSGGIMPKPLPDCPQCESPQLQVSRADARG